MADYSDIEMIEELKEAGAFFEDDITTTGTYLDLLTPNLVYEFSDENMRKAIGNFFVVTKNKDYDKNVFATNVLTIDSEDDARSTDMTYISPLSTKIRKMEVNPVLSAPIDSSVALANYRIPFRMYADSEQTYGDVYWREYFNGGTYGADQFNRLVDTENIYYDIAISFKMPIKYEVLRAYEYLNIDPDIDRTIFEVKGVYKDYNKYVQNYQDWTSNLSSELLIPNYNIITTHLLDTLPSAGAFVSEAAAAAKASDERIAYSESKKNVIDYNIIPGIDIRTSAKDQYYGSFFINYPHSEEQQENAIRHQENIIFDNSYFVGLNVDKGAVFDPSADSEISIEDALDKESVEIEKFASTFYCAKIKFSRHVFQNVVEAPSSADGEVLRYENLKNLSPEQVNLKLHSSLVSDEYTEVGKMSPETLSSKILEIIKDMDEGNITDIPIRMQTFAYNNNYKSVSYDSTTNLPNLIKNASDLPNETIALRSFNYMQFLSYMYNNYDLAINDNYIFMGESRPEHNSTAAEDTLYRNKVSQDILNTISLVSSKINNYMANVLPGFFAMDTTTEMEAKTQYDKASADIFEKILSPTKKFYEVMAYKVEKIGGAVTGDSSTQNVIQKFWIFNSKHASKEISFIDSQVKYGQNYTYKISAYALVMSHKYKYADYRLTKQIGSGQKFDLTDVTEDPKFCLQFYNPVTNEISSRVFADNTSEIISTLEALDLDNLARAAIDLDNPLATSEVDVSYDPQLAEFNLYIEPCLEVVEIPFAQKTIKVMDSPPNAINVIPFHFIDTSNRIGFKIGQDSFIKRPYPELITTSDSLMKSDYLKSKELMSYQVITEPSQSPARFVEMYRINKKPNSFTDFKQGLVATIDLRIENNFHNYLDYVTADEIMPNKKYYYVFRFLNENMMPGPLSQIIEAELVNDGGYIYSLFDVVDSSQFNPNTIQTKSKDCKKIMQLEPHLNQMVFDTSNVDFSNTASEEVKNLIVGIADDLIWDGKRFKIRLTSKKTGRILDLNTGFNLRIKDETEIEDDPIEEETPVIDEGGGSSEEEVTGDDDTVEEELIPPTEPEPTYGFYATPQIKLYESQARFFARNVLPYIGDTMSTMRYGAPATSLDDTRLRDLFAFVGKYLYENTNETDPTLHASVSQAMRVFVSLLAYGQDILTTAPDGLLGGFSDVFYSNHPDITPLTLQYLDRSFYFSTERGMEYEIKQAIHRGMSIGWEAAGGSYMGDGYYRVTSS